MNAWTDPEHDEQYRSWLIAHLNDFLHEARESMHGAESVCIFCGRTITLDAGIHTGGVFDWQDEGDYGCDSNPINDDEGTGGHVATGTRAAQRADNLRGEVTR